MPDEPAILPVRIRYQPHSLRLDQERFDRPAIGRFCLLAEGAAPSGPMIELGVARLPITTAQRDIAAGHVLPLLQDWAPPSVGFYLYYPSRRHTPAALETLIAFLRQPAGNKIRAHE